MTPKKIAEKTVERLIVIHRILVSQKANNIKFIYSHEIAKLSGLSAPQIRRDLMLVGYSGSPAKGYDVSKLKNTINTFLGFKKNKEAVLVGLGYLGRALLGYFNGQDSNIKFSMAFDINPERVNRIISGVNCYHIDEMGSRLSSSNINICVIAVPKQSAQEVAWTAVDNKIISILNFAPQHLRVPENVHVENLDLMTMLEKAAYYSME
ncbi:MAG: redox-sensing transcriptional repressor Rex [Deltaproteobacteria bacterium]|nr:redox-sensing transcriptional repressor Rex [Deltaproteobacteria bacterium]